MTKAFENWARYGAPTAESGELPIMRAAMADLVEILSHARPHGSTGELVFTRDWLLPQLRELGVAPDIDGFGNIWAKVSKPHNSGLDFLWSCHVDTVHGKDIGKQGVRWADDGRTLELVKKKAGRCLGADDGAGVWLLLQMIAAGVPGGYVFHRGEERGRLGSEHIASQEPERLKGYDACVAFDRRGYSDVISHQMGMRCTSSLFVDGFAKALNAAGRGLKYEADDSGSYTDSYSYAEIIPECANISCGYAGEHGPRETLDALHLWRLREAICNADLSAIVCDRDPTVIEYDSWGMGGNYPYGNLTNWGGYGSASRTGAAAWAVRDNDSGDDDALERLIDLIRRYPAATADLLQTYGLNANDLLESMTPTEQSQALAGGWALG